MKKKAIVDRFEGDFIVLELDDGACINIPRTNAPAIAGEGMVVWFEDDHVLEIDQEETARREYDMQARFERLLGKKDFT